MSDDIVRQQAMVLFDRAHKHQLKGEFGHAIELYRRSLAILPTPEAYTFLGWTYSMLDRYEEAIENCKSAIELDPAYGNPYNDIGSYLIELKRTEEAIPWLQKATTAPRYDHPQYPHMNLGRAYEHMGRVRQALACYDRAIELDPFYRAAIWAKYQLLASLN